MLVSTKTLSLMKFVSRTGACPAQIESFAESGYGSLSSPVVSLALAHDFIELCGQQGANRKAFFGREDAGFAQDIGIELESDIRFHVWHGFTCSTILRAAVAICKPRANVLLWLSTCRHNGENEACSLAQAGALGTKSQQRDRATLTSNTARAKR